MDARRRERFYEEVEKEIFQCFSLPSTEDYNAILDVLTGVDVQKTGLIII
jgi:hypothetical protein